MKFVARTPFNNIPELGLDLSPAGTDGKETFCKNYQHDLHVPKGHRFEIAPDADSIKGVKKESDKQTISKLVMFQFVVVDDGTPESKDFIKKIDAEVADELAVAKKAADTAKAAETITVAAILAKLPEMISAAVAASAKAK